MSCSTACGSGVFYSGSTPAPREHGAGRRAGCRSVTGLTSPRLSRPIQTQRPRTLLGSGHGGVPVCDALARRELAACSYPLVSPADRGSGLACPSGASRFLRARCSLQRGRACTSAGLPSRSVTKLSARRCIILGASGCGQLNSPAMC